MTKEIRIMQIENRIHKLEGRIINLTKTPGVLKHLRRELRNLKEGE